MFLLLVFLVLIYSFFIFKDTKDITFFSSHNRTDNEKMLRAAYLYSESGLFKWPGSVHSLNEGKGRAELREFWLIYIAFIQKFFPSGRKYTEHVNITAGIVSHAISTLVIFILSKYFLPDYIALLISTIYLTSIWCTEVILFLGHILYSQVWFLCSLGLILLSFINQDNLNIFNICIFSSGILASLSFTSSSASRKFPPVLILTQIFVSLILVTDYDYEIIGKSFFLITLVFFTTSYIFKQFLRFFNNLIAKNKSQDKSNQKRKSYLVINFFSPIISISLASLVPIVLIDNIMSYLEIQFLFAFGMGVLFLTVLMPNPFKNIVRYITFMDIGSWASHFKAYPNQTKTFGKELPSNFRGEGIKWLLPFFWSVMPIELCLFAITLISMIFCLFTNKISLILFLAITTIGLVPTIVVELTKGLQVGKSYLSSLIGLMITLVLGYEYLNDFLGEFSPYLFTFLTILQIFRFFKIYRNDILPCRIAPSKLRNFLFKNNIKNFFTYKTDYNNQFVYIMLYGYESEFNVNFVKSLKDCPKNSIFIVPPTSSKSVSMETEQEAILKGDFRDDTELNNLFDNKLIEKYSIAKFKTLGNSNFYVNESEVTSYRYHILRQVSAHDRLLSYGWVLDLKLIK